MNFTFENQGAITYLVYQLNNDDVLDSLSLGMITNNKISGITPIVFTQMDEIKFLKYNISSKISAKQFFTGVVNKKRLLGVFSSISTGILSAEEYMIDTSLFLLDLEYIYADVSSCEASLICIPVISSENKQVDLNTFFKNIVFSTQFDQTENCDYVAKIISYLNSTSIFSLVDFMNLIERLLNDNVAIAQNTMKPLQSNSNQVASHQNNQTIIQAASNPYPQQPQPRRPEYNAPQLQQIQPIPQSAVKEKKNWFGGTKKEKTPKIKIPKNKSTKVVPTNNFAIPGFEQSINTPYATSVPTQSKLQVVPQPQVIRPSNVPNMQQSTQVQQIQPVKPAQQTHQAPLVQYPVQQAPPLQPTPTNNNQFPPASGQQPNFGETTVLGGGVALGETSVLGASTAATVKPYLIRYKNNEKIYLDKPVFRIGKEKSYVDYFIGDNTAISRSHANILSQNGEYFVVDTNSTNHTYVNGEMIQSNVESKISHGMKIRLSNEDFEFKLY